MGTMVECLGLENGDQDFTFLVHGRKEFISWRLLQHI